MRKTIRRLGILASLCACLAAVVPGQVALTDSDSYTKRPASRDGIGKFYMGREISQVMGHRGADWLERPERAREENPDKLVRKLGVKDGMIVADIGAGTGYFTRRLAERVGPSGLVYAVDIQPEMLTLLQRNLERRGIGNVELALGTETSPRLPDATVDLALMVDVYHEFSHPYEMLSEIWEALKPGGRVAFVEYRGEDPDIPIKRLHKMTEIQVRKEAERLPFRWVQTFSDLPRQHLILFEKIADGRDDAP